MSTLRKKNGISGFLKINESEYDAFGAGHLRLGQRRPARQVEDASGIKQCETAFDSGGGHEGLGSEDGLEAWKPGALVANSRVLDRREAGWKAKREVGKVR